MDYKKYITHGQRMQLNYIRSERKRMSAASKLNTKYILAMQAIGLHPLTRMEIGDRVRELARMEAKIPETHGDSPSMRASFELHTS